MAGQPTYRLLWRLWPYLRPYLHWLVIGSSLAVVVSSAEGFIAWLVKPALDEIFLKRDVAMLRLIPLMLLGAYLVKGIGRYGQAYLMAAVGERVIARIRAELYRHIQGMSLSFYSQMHSAELMTRVVSDVNRLARLASSVLVMAVRQMATIVALLAVIIFPAVGVLFRTLGHKLYTIAKHSQEKIGELNIVLQEAFTGNKIVKAFGRERLQQERFDAVNDRLLRLALKDQRVDLLAEPVMEILAALGIMGAIWYGGYRVISGALTPGEFFSFTAAVILLYGPVRQLGRMMNTIQQSLSSVERVFEILDQPPAITDRAAAVAITDFCDRLVFEG